MTTSDIYIVINSFLILYNTLVQAFYSRSTSPSTHPCSTSPEVEHYMWIVCVDVCIPPQESPRYNLLSNDTDSNNNSNFYYI